MRRLGLGRVVNAGELERGNPSGGRKTEHYHFFCWLENEWHPDDNVRAATETGITGVGISTIWHTRNLATRRGKGLAGNQLQARKEEDGYRSDPKDRDSRRHILNLNSRTTIRDFSANMPVSG